MSFEIVRLTDHHDCETCGSSYAVGYRIYMDGDLIVDKTPYAHCYSGDDYYNHNPYADILEQMGEHVTESEGDEAYV